MDTTLNDVVLFTLSTKDDGKDVAQQNELATLVATDENNNPYNPAPDVPVEVPMKARVAVC